MAGGFSDYTEALVLSWVFGVAAATRPAALYLALFTSAEGDAGGGTELSGNGYQRQGITFGSPTGTSPTQVTNTNVPTFNDAGADFGTITYVGVFDAQTGGNLIWYAPLAQSQAVTNGGQISFPTGNVTPTLD